MVRRLVSVVRTAAGSARGGEPALEANAYALAEDVSLTLLLRGQGVELAVAGGSLPPSQLAGVPLPPAASAQDLRGLVESGIDVYVDEGDLTAQGLGPGDLVAGVKVLDPQGVADLLRGAEGVLTW